MQNVLKQLHFHTLKYRRITGDMGKPDRQHRSWKITFLHIRNKSNRCWKAQEHLIFRRVSGPGSCCWNAGGSSSGTQ